MIDASLGGGGLGNGGWPDEDDALPLELVGQPGKAGGQGGGGAFALAALAHLSLPQSFHSDVACSVELVGLALCSAFAALAALAASKNQAGLLQ